MSGHRWRAWYHASMASIGGAWRLSVLLVWFRGQRDGWQQDRYVSYHPSQHAKAATRTSLSVRDVLSDDLAIPFSLAWSHCCLLLSYPHPCLDFLGNTVLLVCKPWHTSVFDFMDTDLSKIIRSNQYMTTGHIQFILYQILLAIKYMHSANVIHRDLKRT